MKIEDEMFDNQVLNQWRENKRRHKAIVKDINDQLEQYMNQAWITESEKNSGEAGKKIVKKVVKKVIQKPVESSNQIEKAKLNNRNIGKQIREKQVKQREARKYNPNNMQGSTKQQDNSLLQMLHGNQSGLKEAIIISEIIGKPRCKTRHNRGMRRV